MGNDNNTADKGATMRERIGYCLGGIGGQLANRPISSYLIMFFTNCLLIDPLAAGTVFLIGRIVDAFTDPIMAFISDRTKTKLGTYRPFILFSAIPLGIVFVLCFTAPGFLGTGTQKFAWAVIMYVLETSIFGTIAEVNHGAMATVITKDPVGRAKLAGATQIGSQIALIIVSACTMTIVLKYGGAGEAKGWQIVGMIFGVCIAIAYLLEVTLVKERYQVIEDGQKAAPLKERLKCLKGNTPFFALIIAVLVIMLMSIFAGTAFAYYCMYNLGHAEWIASMQTIGAVCGIVGAFLMPFIAKRFEKRYVMALGAVCAIISVIILVSLKNRTGVLLYSIIGLGIGNAFTMSSIWGLVPDAADYGAYKNGVAAPGMMYAMNMFVVKLAGGVGTYFVGFVLSRFNFDATAATQSAETLQGLESSILWITIIFSAIGFVLTFLMKKIDKAEMEKIRQATANQQ